MHSLYKVHEMNTQWDAFWKWISMLFGTKCLSYKLMGKVIFGLRWYTTTPLCKSSGKLFTYNDSSRSSSSFKA